MKRSLDFMKKIVGCCPEKRTVKKRGAKKQLMYLNDSVASLYKKFRDTTPSVKLSYDAFARKRPFWTVQPTVSARDACV